MIIGILGGKGAGKNTVARYLERSYGARTYAIADELKALLRHTFDLSEDQLHGTQDQKETVDPRWNLSPRKMMERQGDALRRVYGDLFQIVRLLEKIVLDMPRLAVISDIRYRHEALMVHLIGGLWRLNYAPGLRRWPVSHSSEAEWMQPEVDLEINPGSGGIPELYTAVDGACAVFGLVRQREIQ